MDSKISPVRGKHSHFDKIQGFASLNLITVGDAKNDYIVRQYFHKF